MFNQKKKLTSKKEIDQAVIKLTKQLITVIEKHCNLYDLTENDMNVMVLMSIVSIVENNFGHLKDVGMISLQQVLKGKSREPANYIG